MKVLPLIAVFAAAIAIAQTPPIAASHGEGVAISPNGHRATFNYEIAKRLGSTANTPVVRGRFTMAFPIQTPAGQPDVARRIVMTSPRVLVVSGHNADFGGLATMSIPTPNGPETVQGRVQVHVEDLRPGNAPATVPAKDLIRVRFFRPSASNPDGTLAFEFGGAVARGDLVVRSAP